MVGAILGSRLQPQPHYASGRHPHHPNYPIGAFHPYLHPPQRSTIEIGSLLGDPLRGDPLDLGACGAEGAAANKGVTKLRASGAPL